MAIIDMDFDIHRATVQFEKKLPADCSDAGELVFFYAESREGPVVYLRVRTQFVALAVGDRFVPIAHPEKILQFAMPHYGETRVGFLVGDTFQHDELITFAPRVFTYAVDPLRLNIRHIHLPEKPGRVAVFTQTYNEGDMLLYWEAYYGRLVGHENLFVLNNASTDGSCARLDPRTSVINMPKAPVDHEHFAQAQGYLQRFLLLKYDWVIKVDTDELLAVEGDLVETLARTPSGTYKPDLAIEVVHDTDNEAPFDFSQPVGIQRKHFVRGTKLLIRPIVSSVPTTWTSGNHMSHELAEVMPGLVDAHLKYFDLNFLLSKNTKWSGMNQTENEMKICAQISSLQKLDLQALYDLSVKEIRDRLADEVIAVPDWLVGKI